VAFRDGIVRFSAAYSVDFRFTIAAKTTTNACESNRSIAAVDDENLTGNHAGGIGGHVDDSAGDFMRLGDATHRDFFQVFGKIGVLDGLFQERRARKCRRDGIDGDVMGGPFHCQGAGHLADGAFGRGVDGAQGAADDTDLGADGDDAAFDVGIDHAAGAGCGHEEGAFEIYVGNEVEFVFGVVEGRFGAVVTGVVDDGVDAAECVPCLGDEAVDAFQVGYVEVPGFGLDAVGAALLGGLFTFADRAAAEGQAGAVAGGGFGDGFADAFAGSGDDHDFAAQVETYFIRHIWLLVTFGRIDIGLLVAQGADMVNCGNAGLLNRKWPFPARNLRGVEANRCLSPFNTGVGESLCQDIIGLGGDFQRVVGGPSLDHVADFGGDEAGVAVTLHGF